MFNVFSSDDDDDEDDGSGEGSSKPRVTPVSESELVSRRAAVLTLLERLRCLPRSQSKLKVLVFFGDVLCPDAFYADVVRLVGQFQRSITLTVTRLTNFASLVKPGQPGLGNIRRLYMQQTSSWDWERKWLHLDPPLISRTQLLDVGQLSRSFDISKHFDRPFSEWVIRRPMDDVILATAAMQQMSTTAAAAGGAGANLALPALPSQYFGRDERELAYALRVNRDVAHRFFDVCTLVMCARNARHPPHGLWGYLNKDVVRLICGFLSPADWNFVGQRKRNLTVKNPSWAKTVVAAYHQAQEAERAMEYANNRSEKIQKRRRELLDELRALPTKIKQVEAKAEEEQAKFKQARTEFAQVCTTQATKLAGKYGIGGPSASTQ